MIPQRKVKEEGEEGGKVISAKDAAAKLKQKRESLKGRRKYIIGGNWKCNGTVDFVD